jgi:hypothetical protein
MVSAPLPQSALPASRHAGRVAVGRWWHTPLFFLLVYCLVSLLLRENYPISNFPMYANPSADRSYYIVADAATGKPVPIADVSGITCPKIGKTYRKKAEELEAKLNIRKDQINPAQQQAIGLEIFQQLRQSAQESNLSGLPSRLMLQRVDIIWRDDAMTEHPTTLATE